MIEKTPLALTRFLDRLPVLLPVALASFAVPTMILLLMDSFKSVYVLPVGLLAAWLSSRAVYRHAGVERPGSEKEQRICDILIIAAALSWVVFNIPFTSQHIFINRDPAIYTNAGMWLVENDSLRIEKPTVFDGLNRINSQSAGFMNDPQDNSVLLAQGAHLLPALLGLGGRALGVSSMLHLNVIFGGTAILAVYGMARLLTKPRWALVASAALAGSLPLIYFARDTYTEPLAATFTFGALSMICVAMKTRQANMWFLAGIITGAGTLSRIDAYLTIIALAVFVSLFLMTSNKEDRREKIKQMHFFVIGTAVTAVIGWLDLVLLSTGYYQDHFSQFKAMMIALSGVVLVGTLGVIVSWKTKFLKYINEKTLKWLAVLGVVLVLALGVILISQPLWRVSYSSGFNGLVVGLQEAQGPPVDTQALELRQTTRNFAEYAAHWAVWYAGPVIAALSLAGIALSVRRQIKYREMLLAPIVLVVGGTALVYFVKPSITPDQIWASRRLLPVILPGMTIFAAVALSRLWQIPRHKIFNVDGKIVASVLATLAIVSPLIITLPFTFLRERDTHLTAMEETCLSLPNNAAVLWVGSARDQAVQPTRFLCDTPTAGYGSIFGERLQPSSALLQNYASQVTEEGRIPVIGVFGSQVKLLSPENAKKLTEVHNSATQEMEHTLLRPPHIINRKNISIYLGLVQADGSIKRLENNNQATIR